MSDSFHSFVAQLLEEVDRSGTIDLTNHNYQLSLAQLTSILFRCQQQKGIQQIHRVFLSVCNLEREERDQCVQELEQLLSNIPQLELLHISTRDTTGSMERRLVGACSSLKRLRLWSTEAYIRLLLQANVLSPGNIQRPQNLVKLDLSRVAGTEMDELAASVLGQFVNLKEFTISLGTAVTLKKFNVLVQALDVHVPLLETVVCYGPPPLLVTSDGDERDDKSQCLQHLASVLSKKKLVYLCLMNVPAFFSLFSQSTSFRLLSKDASLTKLFQAVAYSHLNDLHLHDLGMSPSVTMLFFRALEQNTCLNSLSLSHVGSLRIYAWMCIADSLARNQTLSTLEIWGKLDNDEDQDHHHMTHDSIKNTVMRKLRNNTRLTEFSSSWCDASYAIEDAVSRWTSRNKVLQLLRKSMEPLHFSSFTPALLPQALVRLQELGGGSESVYESIHKFRESLGSVPSQQLQQPAPEKQDNASDTGFNAVS